MNRRGIALLVALWVIVLLAGLVSHAVLLEGSSGTVAQNRLTLLRGGWATTACLSILLAKWDAKRPLTSAAGDSVELGGGIWCSAASIDPNIAIDVNRASADLIQGLVRDSGVTRRLMAGRPWPAIGAIGGGDAFWTRHLTTEGTGRVNVNLAPPEILAAIPGLSGAGVASIVRARDTRPVSSMQEFLEVLPGSERSVVLARYAEIAGMVTFRPEVIVVRLQGRFAGSPVISEESARLVPSAGRLAVTRRVLW